MKSEEIYNNWKEHKSQIDLRESFADEVMNRIHRYEREKKRPLLEVQQLIDLISAHRFAKAAVLTAGAAAGLFRFILVAYAFLAC